MCKIKNVFLIYNHIIFGCYLLFKSKPVLLFPLFRCNEYCGSSQNNNIKCFSL